MNKLQEICEVKKEHVKRKKTQTPSFSASSFASPTKGFINSLRKDNDERGLGLIAEFKRKSPSKGMIRNDLKVEDVAKLYEQQGASCMSVLTDEPYFAGKDEDLISARKSCNLPLLRKDFMVDVYQVEEARFLGADCILIIIAAVEKALAKDLYQAALGLKMDVLAEIHDLSELESALELEQAIIGVNNRNLKTLEVDLGVSLNIAPHIPTSRLKVSESGISGADDITKLKSAGFNSFLIGESFMREGGINFL